MSSIFKTRCPEELMPELQLDPKKTALVIIDLQNGIIAMMKGTWRPGSYLLDKMKQQ